MTFNLKKYAIYFLLCSCSSSGVGHQLVGKRYKTNVQMFLYDVKYKKNIKYPYSLWDIDIKASPDDPHRQIAIIPRGALLNIDMEKTDNNLIDIDLLWMWGNLTYKSQKYYFESSWSEEEFRKYLTKVK